MIRLIRMIRLTAIPVALFVILTSVGCVDETPGLFIVHNAALDTNCAPIRGGNTATFVGVGVMDVLMTSSYVMRPVIESMLASSSQASLATGQGGGATGGSTGGEYEANRITLDRAEVSITGPSGFDVALPSGLILPISGTLDIDSTIISALVPVNAALGTQLRSSAQLQNRGDVVELDITIQYFGRTISGYEVESNTFVFPLRACRGCLITFPTEAVDLDQSSRNCFGGVGEDSELDESILSCFPGNDRPVDCRICRQIAANPDADCEP